jgi:hypothetical protein
MNKQGRDGPIADKRKPARPGRFSACNVHVEWALIERVSGPGDGYNRSTHQPAHRSIGS